MTEILKTPNRQSGQLTGECTGAQGAHYIPQESVETKTEGKLATSQ